MITNPKKKQSKKSTIKKIKAKTKQKLSTKAKVQKVGKGMKAKQKQINIAKISKTKMGNLKAKQRKEIVEKYLVNPDIRKKLVDVAGENAIPVIRLFKDGSTDEELASKISAKVSDVRATLNKLHGIGLVSYKRMRDSESGWYKYTWMMNAEKIKEWASQEEGVVKEGEYYSCGKCYSGMYSFEDAMEISFRCPHCGSFLDTHHEHS